MNNNINPSYGYKNNVSFGAVLFEKDIIEKLKGAPLEVLQETRKLVHEGVHDRYNIVYDYINGKLVPLYCPIKYDIKIKPVPTSGQLRITNSAIEKLKEAEVLQKFQKLAREYESEKCETIIDYIDGNLVSYCPIQRDIKIVRY